MTTAIFTITAIVILLFASAFFAGSETALTAVSRGLMHRLEKEGSRAAANVNALVADRERLVGSLLLGNTFVNILASSLATTYFMVSFGERAVAIATVLMTFVILVFAEVLPKTLAIARTARFSLAVAGALRAVVYVLAPVVSTVQFFSWRLLSLFGVSEEEGEPVLPVHEEIRGTVELHHKEGSVEREHRDMISGVLDLKELRAADIMVHRKSMVAFDADEPAQSIIEQIIENSHTRIPLWRGQPENIIGVLHTKDLVRAMAQRRIPADKIELTTLAAPPWFVPETMSLEELLAAFRKQRTHFALVVDEYGGLQGLITLEDILDEVFGDIPDEHEPREPPGIRRQPDGTFNVDGDVPIRELNRLLDWNLPDDVATTIAGLIINEARTIPEIGQRFAFFGFKFEILRRQRNQITAIKVIPPAPAGSPAAVLVND